VDPVSGKPLYAWHANSDADDLLEVQFISDAFIVSIAGLFNDPQSVINNPIFINGSYMGNPYSSSDNEFIWPTAQIGPSPVAGMRRVYVISGNSISHTYGPSENACIAYADFNTDMIEGAIPLVWNHTTIPQL